MTILFKDLTAGSTIYSLMKSDSLKYTEATVVSVSAPRAEMQNLTNGQFPINPYRQVVDLTYTINGTTFTDAVDVNSSVGSTTKPGCPTLISTDKEAVVRELHETLKSAEKYVKDVDKEKKKIKECKALIAELDVAYNEKQQTETRFQKLEDAQSQTNELLKSILEKLSSNKLI